MKYNDIQRIFEDKFFIIRFQFEGKNLNNIFLNVKLKIKIQ
jgi:hypothetical protein